MKYCPRCREDFETEQAECPVCGAPLLDAEGGEANGGEAEDQTAIDVGTMVAVMTALNIL